VFIHAVPDNRGNRDGYYCSLVESRRTNGISVHKTIRSFGFISSDRLPYLKAAFNKGNPSDILEAVMRNQKSEKTKNDERIREKPMYKAKLEFVARITMPDGRVIEKTVEASEGIPAPDDFDISTKEGFLASFDAFEKVTLDARNKIGDAISEEYMGEVSKKNDVTP
jgi:hypothetical protein